MYQDRKKAGNFEIQHHKAKMGKIIKSGCDLFRRFIDLLVSAKIGARHPAMVSNHGISIAVNIVWRDRLPVLRRETIHVIRPLPCCGGNDFAWKKEGNNSESESTKSNGGYRTHCLDR